MKLFIIALCFAFALGDIVDDVNKANAGWTAKHYPQRKNFYLKEKTPQWLRNKFPVVDTVRNDLPTSFDARDQWPQCDSVSIIRDQASCGSCWAVGTTSAMSDRLCIQTGDNTLLSEGYLGGCCSGIKCVGSMGCSGGQPLEAWQFMKKYGVPSGGQYNTTGTCYPYPLQHCDHHVTGIYPNCDDVPSGHLSCPKKCVDGFSTPLEQDLRYSKSAYTVSRKEEAIMTEIMTNGPVGNGITVYADFEAYSSGVYKHVNGSYMGGHCMRTIGWGVDATTGEKYWSVTNNWNSDWGEKGIIRILRGVDECGIESEITAGMF